MRAQLSNYLSPGLVTWVIESVPEMEKSLPSEDLLGCKRECQCARRSGLWRENIAVESGGFIGAQPAQELVCLSSLPRVRDFASLGRNTGIWPGLWAGGRTEGSRLSVGLA